MSTMHVYPGIPDLPAPAYGPNGFDARAARFVLDFLTKPDIAPLWDQGTWRSVLDLDAVASDLPEDPDVLYLFAEQKAAALTLFDTCEARCGTTACFAGWTAELGGVLWEVAAADLAANAASGQSLMCLYVPQSWLEERLKAKAYSPRWDAAVEAIGIFNIASAPANVQLADPLWMTTVPVWAGLRLGISGLDASGHWVSDPLDLFGASNDAEDVAAILAAYEADWDGIEINRGNGYTADRIILDEVTVEFTR